MQEKNQNEQIHHYNFTDVNTPPKGVFVIARYASKLTGGVSALKKLFPLKPKNPI